jgi:hypothetical protein
MTSDDSAATRLGPGMIARIPVLFTAQETRTVTILVPCL